MRRRWRKPWHQYDPAGFRIYRTHESCYRDTPWWVVVAAVLALWGGASAALVEIPAWPWWDSGEESSEPDTRTTEERTAEQEYRQAVKRYVRNLYRDSLRSGKRKDSP